jgi:hypothetical protein
MGPQHVVVRLACDCPAQAVEQSGGVHSLRLPARA